MKTNFIFLALMSGILSCTPETVPSNSEEGGGEEDEIQIGVDVFVSSGTRSSVLAGESDLLDMTLYQFRPDGMLHRAYYFDDLDSGIKVSGKKNVMYAFCALMNMGDCSSDMESLDDLADFRYEITSMQDLDAASGIPMVSALQQIDFSTPPDHISLEFTRLVCRVDLSISSALATKGSFALKSVHLRQSPSCVWPFRECSCSNDISDVIDGDCAGSPELTSLSKGGTVSLYVLENCQGDLLSGNVNPRLKIPSSIVSRKDLCTYLEVKADYASNDGVMESSNTYRMYLGEDNCSNFDLVRNTVDAVSVSLSDWTGAENYWKAEWNVSYKALPTVVVKIGDVEVGESVQAVATANFADGSSDSDPTHFKWSSTGCADVTSSGVVTGTGNGKFTLTADYARYPVSGTSTARSQKFCNCQFSFGGLYDVEGIDEDYEDEGYGLKYENGTLTVTMSDDFGHSVSSSLSFTVGIDKNGKYVSFEQGSVTPGYGKIVNGGYVLQSASSSIGTAYMAPGSDVPIWIENKTSLISEEVGLRF